MQLWFSGFPSYGGRELDPAAEIGVVSGTGLDPVSNSAGINFQILHGLSSWLPSRLTYKIIIIRILAIPASVAG